MTAARDPEGRATIYDTLPEGLPRLMPVGRLDIGSEGLLLLTNDGALKRRLELPATGWLRRYRVRAFGEVDDRKLQRPGAGGHRRRRRLRPDRGPRSTGLQGDNVWLTLSLREGKNREVRRVLEHVGLQVNRLIRMAYGPFQLGHAAQALGGGGAGQGAARADRRRHGLAEAAAPASRPSSGGRLSLRIIAGLHRGRRIVAPAGLATRPTSDRAREALFGILEHGDPPLRGCRFLDLFAGSGAAALEAVSRGAALALCIDQASAAVAAIKANIETLGETARVTVLRADVSRLGQAAKPVRHRLPRPALRQRLRRTGAGQCRGRRLAGAGCPGRGRGRHPRPIRDASRLGAGG